MGPKNVVISKGKREVLNQQERDLFANKFPNTQCLEIRN